MDAVAHCRPVDGAGNDGMRSMGVSFLDGAKYTRLGVGNKGHAAVVELPVSACKPIFNAFAAERSRQFVLVGMQNIDAKPASTEQRVMQTC